ncbi:cytochrome P450 [Rhodocollybia butyracea]|uniref:Cytochrome P450 n=1 Tax=Rhodocollybia butyracea TaxID=206335 RepID=A0A9P5Q8N4_9AGAR|nr:cytochrome P450 [Rhodocollybia butyracea]
MISLTVAVLLVVVTAYLYYRYNTLSSPLFPPGPRKSWLTGNTLNIPLTTPWITYANWARQYGKFMGLRISGEGDVVIINSLDAARDLLERRAQIYSDRPFSTMDDLGGWHFNVGAMPYGDRWRKHRRLFQQSFRPAAIQNFQPTQRRKIHDLVVNLVNGPDEYEKHVGAAMGAIIMSTIYGHDKLQKNDPFIETAEKASQMRGLFPHSGEVPCQHFPSWLPGCDFQRYAQMCRGYTRATQDEPFKFALEQTKRNNASSLVAGLVEQLDPQDPSYAGNLERIRNVAATIYLAGSSTSKSVILTFMLAMTLNPLAQAKAQEEIDRVIGTQRLPDFTDRKRLSYVEAVYRETARWYPAVPLGTPRRAVQTDMYDGYCIPEGTTMYPNIWAISRDETRFEDPDCFKPERFLDSGGPFASINDMLLFGFGRRVCPGRHMADAQVWMAIVSILATLKIEKGKDTKGNDVQLGVDYTDTLICHPKHFQCSITPRMPQYMLISSAQ